MSRITSSSKGDREEEGRRRMGDFLQRLSVCFLCSWPSFEILSKLFTDVNLETFPVILTFIYLLITPGKFISAHPTSQMTLQPSSYPDEGQSAPLASNSLSLVPLHQIAFDDSLPSPFTHWSGPTLCSLDSHCCGEGVQRVQSKIYHI